MTSTVANKLAEAPEGGMSAELMRGPWFKEYAELGHWFDNAHGKCVRCGTETIDLYEDGSYGATRPCKRAEQLARDGAE